MILLTPLFHAILLFSLFLLVVKRVGGKPLLLIGALVDISFNWVWGTLLFMQIPRELFFSQRIIKNTALPCWRGKLAQLICNVLNHFLADHCKE